MNWGNRYELLEPVRKEPRSFRGRERQTGTPVILHLLEAGGNRTRAALDELASLPPECFLHIREVGEHQGIPFVATDTQYGMVGLKEWLRLARASAGGKESAAPGGALEARPPASEFTRLFRVAGGGPAESKLPPAGSAPANTRPTSDPAPPAAPAGEFTRLFQSPESNAAAHRPEPDPASLTRLFQPRNSAAAGDGASAFAEPADDPGELARLLSRSIAAEPPAAGIPARGPALPPPTKMTQEPPPAPAPKMGDLTRLLQSPAADRAPAVVEPPRPASLPAPAPPAPQFAASEYTRVIMAQPSNPPTPPKPAIPPAHSEAEIKAHRPQPSRLTQVLVFSLLAAAAVALILYFALAR